MVEARASGIMPAFQQEADSHTQNQIMLRQESQSLQNSAAKMHGILQQEASVLSTGHSLKLAVTECTGL